MARTAERWAVELEKIPSDCTLQFSKAIKLLKLEAVHHWMMHSDSEQSFAAFNFHDNSTLLLWTSQDTFRAFVNVEG